MKIMAKFDDAAAQVIASRWKLTLQGCIAETPRARVFKVDSPDGPAALKLYKEIGSSGEGVAVHFLRNLAPQVGPKIHRISFLRTAVLMEWLDGTSLNQFVGAGEDARAIKLLGEVAHAISKTNFKRPFIYQRVVPKLERDFANCVVQPNAAPEQNELQRSIALLDHLVQTSPRERVVHGDLGFNNVILTANGPRMIDPKGLRADPAFELAKALIEPYDNVSPADFIQRVQSRAAILTDVIDIKPLRLIQWATIVLARKTLYSVRKRPQNSRLLPYLTTLLDASER